MRITPLILFPLLFISGIARSQVPTNSYSITIGNQVWMSNNLSVNTFANGDTIPEALTAIAWKKAAVNHTPAWCYYKGDNCNGMRFGKLYNWYAVIDPRGLARKGWHVPNDAEWTILASSLFGEYSIETNMKNEGELSYANSSIKRARLNSSGFMNLLGGYRYEAGIYNKIGYTGFWWSANGSQLDKPSFRYLSSPFENIGSSFGDKGLGMSVRCIKD
jgi:uncharacterized protein (TIGR02145 family)